MVRIMGVDPGKQTGVAVIESLHGDCPPPIPGLYWAVLKTVTHRDADEGERIEAVEGMADWWRGHGGLAAVAVQTPFGVGRAPVYHPYPMSLARHAGFVGRLCEALRNAGQNVIEIPSQDCRKKGLKMDVRAWNANWKVDWRTSEHARDAAQIALMGAARIQRGG